MRAPILLQILLFFLAVPLLAQQTIDSHPVKLSGYLQVREVYQRGVGLTGSINRARLTASGNVIKSVAWRIQGEFRTGVRYFGDSTRYGIDVAYATRRITLRGEYLRSTRDGTGGPYDRGWYGLGSFLVTPIVQRVGKYEELDRPSLNPVKNQAQTAGLNLYSSGRKLRLTFDYVSRAGESPALAGAGYWPRCRPDSDAG